MIVITSQIPAEGSPLRFEIDVVGLNARVDEVRKIERKAAKVLAPAYEFQRNPGVEVMLTIEGSTVFIEGSVKSNYVTMCARCAEEAQKSLDIDVSVILKPVSERLGQDDNEGLSVSYYEGEEINCSAVIEELLVLALPYTVLCDKSCKGLCHKCGANLNIGFCACEAESNNDSPFSALKQLKVH